MAVSLRALAVLIPASLFATSAWAGQPTQVAELADLSLEQLANVTVTSASRRAEPLIDAPASIFVITAEDIRRSGATTLPEALRLAPNLQVVRGDSNQYVISARGGLFGTANKMLVLVDGRTIYTPLFAGVFWDAQATMLEDIERIEVISGPGGTLWGTNAVNGVINIITRSAQRTQGALVSTIAGGSQRRVNARWGENNGANGAWRTYAIYDNRNGGELANGASAHDASERWQAGFRADWDRGKGATTLQGDLYRANVDNLGGPRDLSGGNLRGRWTHTLGEGSELVAQAYVDRADRRHEGSFEESLTTAEVELQQALRYGRGSLFVWGGAWREARDRTTPTPVLGFIPADATLRMGSLYAQDEHALSDALRATFGLRAEHNGYTGLEWLPSARLAYLPASGHLLWTAVSRAVRSPSRLDRDLVVPATPPFVVADNDTFRSEIADVVEVGWRGRLAPRTTLSLTAFHHRFRDLRTAAPVGSAIQIRNGGEGRTSGLEGWADFTVRPDWRLVAGFVALSNEFELRPGESDVFGDRLGNNPRRTASLRSLWNITARHELDLSMRYVSALENPVVPSYTTVDARAGWRLSREMDVSLLVTNAFNRRYSEFGTPAERTAFERGVLLRVTWTP